MTRCTSIAPTILLGLSAALGIQAAEAHGEAQACAAIGPDSERLACYDETFGRPGQAVVAAAVLPPTRAGRAQQDFGLSDAEKRARDPEAAKESLPQLIEAKVVAVDRDPRGALIVTLDNDQVWIQSEAVTHARPGVDDVVAIRKAAMGSYQLVTPGRVAMRVRRVR